MKKRDTQWRDVSTSEMTTQEVGNLLLLGWQAAQKGEPLDFSQAWHWVQGYRLWCSTHQPPDPLAANH